MFMRLFMALITALCLLVCLGTGKSLAQRVVVLPPQLGPPLPLALVPPVANSVNAIFPNSAIIFKPKADGSMETRLSDAFNLSRSSPSLEICTSIPLGNWRVGSNIQFARKFQGTGKLVGTAKDDPLSNVELCVSTYRFDGELPVMVLPSFFCRPVLSWQVANAQLRLRPEKASTSTVASVASAPVRNGTSSKTAALTINEQATRSAFGVGVSALTRPPFPRVQTKFIYFFDRPSGYMLDVQIPISETNWWNRASSVMIGYRRELLTYGLGSADIVIESQGPYVGLRVLF